MSECKLTPIWGFSAARWWRLWCNISLQKSIHRAVSRQKSLYIFFTFWDAISSLSDPGSTPYAPVIRMASPNVHKCTAFLHILELYKAFCAKHRIQIIGMKFKPQSIEVKTTIGKRKRTQVQKYSEPVKNL